MQRLYKPKYRKCLVLIKLYAGGATNEKDVTVVVGRLINK